MSLTKSRHSKSTYKKQIEISNISYYLWQYKLLKYALTPMFFIEFGNEAASFDIIILKFNT